MARHVAQSVEGEGARPWCEKGRCGPVPPWLVEAVHQTSSAATQPAGTPATRARSSIRVASAGLVAKTAPPRSRPPGTALGDPPVFGTLPQLLKQVAKVNNRG